MTELRDIEARLAEQRPTPRPGFRGDLSRRLARDRARSSGFGPRAQVLSYACSGLLLLAVAAAGLGGVGPFAT